MPAKPKPPELPKPFIENGQMREPVYLWRALFSNGDVVEVHAAHDNSVLRELLLKERKIENDRIEGVARVSFAGYTAMAAPKRTVPRPSSAKKVGATRSGRSLSRPSPH